MSTCCPTCGQPLPGADAVAELRLWLEARGHTVDYLDRTDTAGAAAALGLAPGTLRNDRAGYQRIPFERTPAGCRYALSRIVLFAAARRGE